MSIGCSCVWTDSCTARVGELGSLIEQLLGGYCHHWQGSVGTVVMKWYVNCLSYSIDDAVSNVYAVEFMC